MVAPKLTDQLRADIVALAAPPEELSVREIADRLKLGKSVVAEALALARGKAPSTRSARAKTARRAATGSPAAPRSPKRATGAQQAAGAASASASRAGYAPPAVVGFLPAPPPAKLAADLLDEVLVMLAEIRGRMAPLPANSAEYRALATEFGKLLARAEAVKAKRPPELTDAQREAAAKPRAEEVLGKIRSGVRAWAQREAETATCCRCGAGLGPELVVRRRVEAGLGDVAPGAA